MDNTSKIEIIESKIKKIYFNCKNADEFRILWNVHIKPVINISKKLAKKYGADLEIVWLSAILHDIARVDGLKPHDVVGSKIAYEILIKSKFEKVLAKQVSETILTHSNKKFTPRTVEQKILCTADAMSHFTKPFFLFYIKFVKKDFTSTIDEIKIKVKNDWNRIFFGDEKEQVKSEYQALTNWLN